MQIMKAFIFFNETEFNGRIQIMTTIKLEGRGIINFGGSNIVNYNNELHKGNINYWVSKKAFGKIKNNYELTRVCF